MINAIITAIHLAALSQIESGNNDHVVGHFGEITRYQIMPHIAQQELLMHSDFRGHSLSDPGIASLVAERVWEKRAQDFKRVYNRPPNLQELYLCWHRPSRVLKPSPRERERAQRFENLYLELARG